MVHTCILTKTTDVQSYARHFWRTFCEEWYSPLKFFCYIGETWINLFLKHDIHSVSFHVLRNLCSCLRGDLPSKHNLKLDRKHMSYASLGPVSSSKNRGELLLQLCKRKLYSCNCYSCNRVRNSTMIFLTLRLSPYFPSKW